MVMRPTEIEKFEKDMRKEDLLMHNPFYCGANAKSNNKHKMSHQPMSKHHVSMKWKLRKRKKYHKQLLQDMGYDIQEIWC